jgi:hypothetical protein
MNKSVYILGAGFSKGLNAPLQSEIIKEIFDLDPNLLEEKERKLYQKYKIRLM